MIIQTDRQLADFCAELRNETAIFVDTEFVGEGRYYPEVGAIQVASPTQAALIDPLAITNLVPLGEILAHPGIVKVFHAATQDLAIFYRLFARPTAPLFDTQIAAALLGYDEQISFANLVERVTGVHLAKSHSFTDWLRRPLSAGQIEYALDDVRYLAKVYDHLVAELQTQGRLEWAREEYSPLENEARFQPSEPRELYLKLRGVERIHGPALVALRELIAWREETARALNIPSGKIARDEVMMELARHPRLNVKELREVRGLQPQQVDRFGREMIEIARQDATVPCPRIPRPPSLPPVLEPTVDFLILCLRSLAGEMALSPGLLATRSDLAALIQSGERAEVPLMRGWRRQAVGNALLATLQGKATARVIPGSRQVHLEWHN